MLTQLEKTKFANKIFTLRPVTMADLTVVTKLLNKSAIDQTGVPDMTESLLKSEWTGPGFHLEESVRVAQTPDGQIVGYIEVWDTDPLPVSNWVWARVHPDFEGLGIGSALMKWAEQRLQQTISRVPPDMQVVYRSGSLSTHNQTKKLLDSLGMKPTRYYWRMVIDLDQKTPEPKWPENITLTTLAEIDDLPAVYRAFADSFQDHYGHVDQPEEKKIPEWEHWISTDSEFDPSLWYIAMDGQEIAGICLCRRREWEDPEMGWVNIFGVRRPWRKQGLGLAMLHYAFGEFYRRGKLRAGLGVDAGSLTGATRLYAKAGMHVAREYHDFEKVLRPGLDIRLKTL